MDGMNSADRPIICSKLNLCWANIDLKTFWKSPYLTDIADSVVTEIDNEEKYKSEACMMEDSKHATRRKYSE